MSTLKDYNLIGKVYSVDSLSETKFVDSESVFSEWSYEFDEKGRLTSKYNQVGNGEQFYFNRKGNISKWIIKGRDGEEERKLKYKYNQSGELVEELTYSKKPYQLKSKLLFIREIINFKGRMVESRLFFSPNTSPCSHTKYFYKNNKKHRIETSFFDAKPGEVSRTQMTVYDSNGRIKELHLGNDSFIYKYNRKGSLINERSYIKGVLYQETEFQYSTNGKIISKESQYFEKNEKWHYAYKTDSIGNWVEEYSKKLSTKNEKNESDSTSILKRRSARQKDNEIYESKVEFLIKREIEYY
jgi:hypothetical protein